MSERHAPRISVCIVCRNEVDKLPGCLESVRWADEIVVMDLSSTDDSAEVAKQYGARVIPHEPVSAVEAVRNELAGAASGEWILVLDPDERVSPGLAQALRSASAREDIDAVEVPVMQVDFGREPRDPLRRYDIKSRFYRRDRVHWSPQTSRIDPVPRERRLTLPKEDAYVLVHDRERDIPGLLDRAMRIAPFEAQSLLDRGEVFSARKMVLVLAQKSHKYFIHGRPFDDGVHGLVRAGAKLAHHFYVWAALWDMSGRPSSESDERFLRRFGTLLRLGWKAAWPARRLTRLARRSNGGEG